MKEKARLSRKKGNQWQRGGGKKRKEACKR